MESTPRILIVDDEPFNVDYLQQELEDLNCETSTATDGRRAIEHVRTEPPDLILLDIMMPEMDGFQVLAELQASETWRDIPVIVISALDDLDSVVRGIKLGAEDYLPKPFDPLLLKARIGACLGRKRLRDREVQHLQRINSELALAWKVQSGFLPDELPQIPGWQFAAALHPSRETSGDFYDIIALPDGRLGLLVADVSGKGMGAALSMVLSRTLIRSHAARFPTQPAAVFAATNQRILADIHTDQFVTAFYGILDASSGTLVYCNAGHNPLYWLSAHDAGDVRTLRRTGMPLGVLEDSTWQEETISLHPGDALILYSDGITDAQDPQGSFWGEERLLETALANLGKTARAIQETLLGAVNGFMAGAPAFDDITLAVVVRNA